jgi:outer membrane protein assembly factor BamB
MEGATLPAGTVKWSAGSVKGCTSTKIIPAVPSADGPDVFEQSQCEDGQYLAAYTADGVQLWRRKIGGAGAAAVAGATGNAPVNGRLELRSTSVCDSILIGTDRQKIRDLLHQHNLTFNEGSPAERVWIVDESTTQCKLWFDDKSALAKKRKIFITQ